MSSFRRRPPGGRSGAVSTTGNSKLPRSGFGEELGFTGEWKKKEVGSRLISGHDCGVPGELRKGPRSISGDDLGLRVGLTENEMNEVEKVEEEEEEEVGVKSLLKKAASIDASHLSQSEFESNRQQQEDELLVLQSIYGPDYVSIGAQHAAFMINVHLKIPDEGIKVAANEATPQLPTGKSQLDDTHIDDTLKDGILKDGIHDNDVVKDDTNNADDDSFTLQALPPISLLCVLPPTYPSHSPPLFQLTCLWLSASQLSSLCPSLDSVWKEAFPEVVVYMWSEWLRSEALHQAGAVDNLRLQLDSGEKSAVVKDKRVVSGLESFEVDIFRLLRYNEEVKNREFLESVHSCAICFSEFPGTSFTRLPSCPHHFCSGCMRQYCETRLKDGSVMNLTCPEFSCKGSIPSELLRELLDGEAFERWEELLAQKVLDSMPDVVYCPRCKTPSREDPDHYVQCNQCRFSFCTLCMSTWHPGQSCMTPEAKLRILQARRQGREAGEESLRQERELINDVLDMDYIKKEAKQCPQCRIAVEKSEGCNKMTCGNCGNFFCFQCGKSVNGYDHFRNNQSCVLFDQTEIDRWEVAFNLEFQEQQGRLMPQHNPRVLRAMAAARLCPNCKQVNYKDGGNNHIFCWACQNHYCGLCQKMVRRGAGHYGSGPTKCKQHTAD